MPTIPSYPGTLEINTKTIRKLSTYNSMSQKLDIACWAAIPIVVPYFIFSPFLA
jgi:hypothetical protein